VQTDILSRIWPRKQMTKTHLRISQIITISIGFLAILLANYMTNVLDLMLYSYAFMVSGLFIPVLMALYTKRPNATAAFAAMLAGGSTTILLSESGWVLPLNLDANIFGISASLILYLVINQIKTSKVYVRN
jgi:SSS family solute:Na+ symporter